MAEAQVAQLQPKGNLAVNQAIIQGKIAGRRKIKTQEGVLYLYLLKLAAVDSYSHPSTVELRSYDPLGEIEETITVRVMLGGMPNNYDSKSTDEDGNEKKVRVFSARNEYTVIPE
jgi:hypothetical protein